MSREEIQKLLGGYATDTLSEAERRALFEAALEDQELFDALAKEQGLREMLQDPSARRQLIEALGTAHEPIAARAWRGLGWLHRPAALAMAGVAVLLIVGGLALRQAQRPPRREAVVAEVTVPQSEATLAAAPKAVPPGSVQRKMFNLPAARVPEPSAPLPAPPVLTESSPAAPPPSADALAVGGLAGAGRATPPATRPVMQTVQITAQSFTARSAAPLAAMKKAKAVPSAAATPSVGYTLLLKDADGVYSPVPSGTVFHAGDSLRLQVEPSAAGYIYLFQRNASSGWDLIVSQSVEKDQRYALPPTGGLQSDVPAQVELLLVLSRVEHVDLDALASQAQASSRITIEYR
jgi:hypothetical protein